MAGLIYQQQRLDKPGIAYLCIALVWLVGICVGIRFIVQHRHYSSFRHRDVWMTLVSLIALCTITVFCLIQYPTNGTIPCSLDFWVYAIFLPFSIVTTLVKAARLLFLYRAHERAAMLIKSPSIESNHQIASSVAPKRSFLAVVADDWRYINDVISGKEQKRPAELSSFFSKVCSYLLAFHVVMTFAVYMADPSIGDRVVQCHSGWQWIPHQVAILIYIFVCGPIILFASRDIHDSLHMKLEMQIMVYGYMITAPLCIIAQVSSAFNAISDQFPTFMWFVPILMIVSLNMFLLPLIDRWHLRQAERAVKTETILPGATINKELAQVLIRDDKGFERFKEFTVRDLSVENPLFARQVIKWRNQCLPKESVRATSSLGRDGTGFNVAESGQRISRMSAVDPDLFSKGADGELAVPMEDTDNAVSFTPASTLAPVPATTPSAAEAPLTAAAKEPAAPLPGPPAGKKQLKPELYQQAIDIFKGFIEDNARMEINIVNDTKRKIIHEIRLNNITPQLFDQALVEICNLMHTDTWPRYLRDIARRKGATGMSKSQTNASKRGRLTSAGKSMNA